MGPILWLDKQLLKLFNKIVKVLNWSFGLGQFFMARLALTCGLFAYFLYVIHDSKFSSASLLVFFCVLVLAFNFHLMMERDLISEQLKEAKSLEFNSVLSMIRLYCIVVNLILLKTGYVHFYLFIIWAYFLSVDMPPFKPKLVPIPVRSN